MFTEKSDCAGSNRASLRFRIAHFNGLSAGWDYSRPLALVLRTSDDNGKNWSRARLINPVRDYPSQPVQTNLQTREGYLVMPSDWALSPDGDGTALWISKDRGSTWYQAEGQIYGIHAAVTQLADGRLLAYGRNNNIDGMMPKSISNDLGESWRYEASQFPPVGGGQRPALIALRNGGVFFASFDPSFKVRDAEENAHEVSGLFGALSYDGGETWPVKKLITPGGAPRTIDGGGNTGEFTLSATSAETRGYLAGLQTPDGFIHIISSRNYYKFNTAWLKKPMEVPEQ